MLFLLVTQKNYITLNFGGILIITKITKIFTKIGIANNSNHSITTEPYMEL